VRRLQVHALHLTFRIAQARGGADRNGIGNLREIVLAELDRKRADVFDQPLFPFGAGYREDVVTLRQQPGERELAERAVMIVRDLLNAADQ
jgi:hypothetical protein